MNITSLQRKNRIPPTEYAVTSFSGSVNMKHNSEPGNGVRIRIGMFGKQFPTRWAIMSFSTSPGRFSSKASPNLVKRSSKGLRSTPRQWRLGWSLVGLHQCLLMEILTKYYLEQDHRLPSGIVIGSAAAAKTSWTSNLPFHLFESKLRDCCSECSCLKG